MRNRLSIFMLILVWLALVFATSSAEKNQTNARRVELLETGEFHGDEITARTGERWLGLYVTDHSSTLLSYRLTVETVHDGIVDQDAEQETGKDVSVDLPLDPVFLVKGATMLSAGPVTTVFSGNANFEKTLEKVSPINLKLGEVSYVLKVVGADDNSKCSEHAFPRNAKLVLVSGESAQILYSLEECGNEPYWHLLWAGDLDRDGRLDLYVSVTQHYNVSERKLFLSSQAGDDHLVKEVAEFVTSGC
jgi:hypothetical protein